MAQQQAACSYQQEVPNSKWFQQKMLVGSSIENTGDCEFRCCWAFEQFCTAFLSTAVLQILRQILLSWAVCGLMSQELRTKPSSLNTAACRPTGSPKSPPGTSHWSHQVPAW